MLQSDSGASRMMAKTVIQEDIKRKDKKIKALQILLDKIPWDSLTREEEETLWEYFVSRN